MRARTSASRRSNSEFVTFYIYTGWQSAVSRNCSFRPVHACETPCKCPLRYALFCGVEERMDWTPTFVAVMVAWPAIGGASAAGPPQHVKMLQVDMTTGTPRASDPVAVPSGSAVSITARQDPPQP